VTRGVLVETAFTHLLFVFLLVPKMVKMMTTATRTNSKTRVKKRQWNQSESCSVEVARA